LPTNGHLMLRFVSGSFRVRLSRHPKGRTDSKILPARTASLARVRSGSFSGSFLAICVDSKTLLRFVFDFRAVPGGGPGRFVAQRGLATFASRIRLPMYPRDCVSVTAAELLGFTNGPSNFGFVQNLLDFSVLTTKDFLALAWLCANFTIA
jgi:hypothetical protein